MGDPEAPSQPSSGTLAPFVSWLFFRLAPTSLALIPGVLVWFAFSSQPPVFETDSAGREFVGEPRNPRVLLALGSTAAGAAYWALLAWSRRSAIRVRPIPRPAAAVGVIASLLGFACGSVLSCAGFGRARFDDARLEVGGITYRQGTDGALSDRDELIGRVISSSPARTWIEVVARRDSTGALLFATDKRAESDDPVLRGDSGGRVYLLFGPECLVAFDPHDTRIRDAVQRDGMHPEEISPFALVGPEETGAASIADRIAGLIAEKRAQDLAVRRGLSPPPGQPWAPSDAVLLAALDSPNAWVRETARRFVREGGTTLYPKATKRL